MNEQTVQKIIESVVIFLSSGVGAALLGVIVKAIISGIAAVKQKKYGKLSENDKKEIAALVVSSVLEAMQGGVKIDAEAIIDKYTNGRINALEERYNGLIASENKMQEYMRAVLAAVGDFRTISNTSRETIAGLLADNGLAKVETIAIPEQPTVEFSAEKVAEKPAVKY